MQWSTETCSFLPFDARFPVIFPRDVPITRLIARSYHGQNYHSAGTNHLLSMLLKRLWRVSGKKAIKKCTNHCMIL